MNRTEFKNKTKFITLTGWPEGGHLDRCYTELCHVWICLNSVH